MIFHLPLWQTEGFLRCLAEMLEVDLPIPDHTTLSRRLKRLSEAQLACRVLNTMTSLGMPDSYRVG